LNSVTLALTDQSIKALTFQKDTVISATIAVSNKYFEEFKSYSFSSRHEFSHFCPLNLRNSFKGTFCLKTTENLLY